MKKEVFNSNLKNPRMGFHSEVTAVSLAMMHPRLQRWDA